MNVELVAQSVTVVVGMGAFVLGLVGIGRSLQLQRLLVRKQQEGLDAAAVKADPQVRAAMRRLRMPLLWATLLAACSVAAPLLARRVLA
ncbi:hypothetical protein DSC_08500 [Pseudoxanthomonas spadix BD-a59]|jgi:hypothetical protein|uniref:Transmembrane protein n=1 Tax=Pseudoxanthomonas spadix (strain BD-a59) TaxID=1045855 RepID=G7UV70_PSEUP|nr:hypothetical protein [Pseudoxanthomonas spadix]AER56350.1 hypothetical protein DSC_08500 [Pseudoxanthomonas spadix BD-a59]